MIALFLMLAAAGASASTPAPSPHLPSMLGGDKAWHPGCAKFDASYIPPAQMLDWADAFRDHLPDRRRRDLDRALPRAADGRIARCDDLNGTSCDAAAYARAFRQTGLSARFDRMICTSDRFQLPAMYRNLR